MVTGVEARRRLALGFCVSEWTPAVSSMTSSSLCSSCSVSGEEGEEGEEGNESEAVERQPKTIRPIANPIRQMICRRISSCSTPLTPVSLRSKNQYHIQ
jgi:hypothetical protein